MNLIRISTKNEISIHPFPDGNCDEQNEILRNLIGNGCDIYEYVEPRRLYTDFGANRGVTAIPGEAVSLLIDEEGKFKSNEVNTIASFLYETDSHGDPIMGNVLLVGEEYIDEGISFCGIEENQFQALLWKLKELVRFIEETEVLG